MHTAGQDGGARGVDVCRLDLLQVLRLITAPAPPSGAGGVEAQRASQPVIGVDAGQQAIQFPDTSPGSVTAKLEEAPYGVAGLVRQDGGYRALVQAGKHMSMPAHECQDPR